MYSINQLSNKESQCLEENRNIWFYKFEVISVGDKGFGLVAKIDIPSGNLICRNLAKALSNDIDCNDMNMFQYLFSAPNNSNKDKSYVIVCGEMVFLNHSNDPTSKVGWCYEESGLLFAELRAIRNIRKSEEITIKYADIKRYLEWNLI